MLVFGAGEGGVEVKGERTMEAVSRPVRALLPALCGDETSEGPVALCGIPRARELL